MTKPRSKSQRAFLGDVAFSVLSLAAPLLFAFIATPLLVRGMGVEDYGYYSLVLAVIGFGFTTGIGRTPAKYIPEKRAAGQSGELARLLSAAIFITLVVALVEGGALAAAAPFLISRILGVPDAAAGQLKIAIYLACAIGFVMMLSQLFQSALQGIHRFRTFAAITIAASFLLNLGSVILAVNGFPYTNIFVLNLAVSAAAAAVFLILSIAEVPELMPRQAIEKEALKTVAAFAVSIFVYQSITSIFYLFERSYILRNYGPKVLTYYTIPLMLGIYLHGVVLAISQVTIPKFNERLHDFAGLLAIYQTLTKLVASGSIFLALIFYSFGQGLLELWLGKDFAERSARLLTIDSAAFALIALLIPAWILSESARRPGINAASPLVTYIVGIFAMLLIGPVYGIEGVALGRLVGAIAALPIIVIVERMVFERVFWRLWLSIGLRIAAASFVMLIVGKFIVSALGITWPGFVLGLLVTTLSFWGTLLLGGYIDRSEIIAAFAANTDQGKDSEITAAMQ